MKSVATKLLAILLVAMMLLPMLAACGETTEDPQGQESGNGAVSEQATDKQPSVEKKDYGEEEFNAVYCQDIFRKGYYFIEDAEREPGNDLDDKVYERMLNVEEHLGVDIVAIDGGGMEEYTGELKNTISSGDDSFQMVMTHVYYDVANLITSNYLRDFNDFDSVQLDAEYWNSTLMEDLAINDKMYCGYNDFCLANCYVIGFNKHMVGEYTNVIGDLYEQVRNKTWTLEKLIEYSALVSRDNGDGQWDDQDTYGFSCWAWVPLISFQISSDIKMVREDADGDLYLSPMKDNGEKIVDLDEMIYDFMNAESTYTYSPFDGKQPLSLKSNRVMFELINNFSLVSTKEEEVKVGVLPYPLWDTNQENYYTMNWNGVLGVPTTVKNVDMVGDVVEMLAWFSEPVTTAFYETLLGSKVADAPEDVEMLNIIWDSQVSDIGLVFSSSSPQMDRILYAIPHHVSVKDTPAYSTYYSKNYKAAEKLLNNMFKEKK